MLFAPQVWSDLARELKERKDIRVAKVGALCEVLKPARLKPASKVALYPDFLTPKKKNLSLQLLCRTFRARQFFSPKLHFQSLNLPVEAMRLCCFLG